MTLRTEAKLAKRPLETRDWPHSLRVSAEAVTLAEQLYLSRCAVYSPAQAINAFESLESSARRPYIDQAVFILRSYGVHSKATA